MGTGYENLDFELKEFIKEKIEEIENFMYEKGIITGGDFIDKIIIDIKNNKIKIKGSYYNTYDGDDWEIEL